MRCTTPLRLANLMVAKAQRLLRRDRVIGMPPKYFIDPINICNLRCPLCPTGRGVLARPRGRMRVESLKKVIDEIAAYAYRVELYNWGEPLLHPEIFEMIEYVSRRRISVGLSSNLNYFDEDMAQDLVRSGLSQLVVSIDGATQASYSAYRQRGDLQAVVSNLEMLLETRRRLKQKTPFVIWRMLVGKHNEHEVEAVRGMAHAVGVDAFVTGTLIIDTRDSEQVEQWLPTDPSYSCYNYDQELRNTWQCSDLWELMVVNWDGGVSPCCWLHDPQYDFGNVNQQTVRAIWNGPNYISARRSIGQNRARSSQDVWTICHRCRGHPDYMAY
jgi:radical SAM protein with 4Fe4S-binding SPASM domain